MFEKMTARERKLAMSVLCLLPATLLFMAVFWVIGAYGDNNDKYMSLSAALANEEDRELSAILAERRRNYYNSISLSPQVENASNEYQIWLKTLLKKTNLSYKTITPGNAGEFKKNNLVIGEKKRFSFAATGKLDELTDFLTRFYRVDALHRINSMKIIPKTEAAGNTKVHTGELSATFVIEVAALGTADDNPDFAQNIRELARDEADYKAKILRRNIFGPANNVPTVSARPSSSYRSMSDAKISVTGKDVDDQDKLSFELVQSDVEGVKLEASPGKRSARLLVPGQQAGKYKLKLKVTDSGFPPKESFADVTVTFKDQVVKKTPPPPPPKPEFVHAKETRITGITRLSNGQWQVWVKVRTTGQKHKLLVGDSFKLDKLDWVVESIQPHSAVFMVDGKQLKFNDRVTFNNPLTDEEVAE